MKVLVIGPSGSGKTYTCEKLAGKGLPTVDADTINGLHGWFNGEGNKVSYPENADKEFLDNHEFLWDRNFLMNYLEGKKDIYIFGLSGNVFDMIGLFDKVFYLTVPDEVLISRLQHPSRKNPMGNTDYQRNVVVQYAHEMEVKAKESGINILDGTKTPEQIFELIK